jgi:retron-type reverse transcriptase
MEPIFDRDFAEQSYGFRPQRGALAALARVETLLMSGHTWIVDADLKAYLDPYSYYTLADEGGSKSCG